MLFYVVLQYNSCYFLSFQVKSLSTFQVPGKVFGNLADF